MAFYISNPKLSPFCRIKLRIAARRDASAGAPELDAQGCLCTNTVKELAAKANEAAKNEATRYNGKRYGDLRSLYTRYESKITKLHRTYEERDAALDKARGIMLPEDARLDQGAMQERVSARCAKPSREYAALIRSLKDELEKMSDEANGKYDLAGYEALRLEAATHCCVAVCHHYDWPAQVYAKYLCRILGCTRSFDVPELESAWPEDLDRILPKLDFTKHGDI